MNNRLTTHFSLLHPNGHSSGFRLDGTGDGEHGTALPLNGTLAAPAPAGVAEAGEPAIALRAGTDLTEGAGGRRERALSTVEGDLAMRAPEAIYFPLELAAPEELHFPGSSLPPEETYRIVKLKLRAPELDLRFIRSMAACGRDGSAGQVTAHHAALFREVRGLKLKVLEEQESTRPADAAGRQRDAARIERELLQTQRFTVVDVARVVGLSR